MDNSPLTVLECLQAGIPFLASRVGGIPELLAEEDRDRLLFPAQPRALAQRLGQVLRWGARPGRSTVDPQANRRVWLDWHNLHLRQPRRQPASGAERSPPLVSVCLTHFNRPEMLRQALDSLRAQDYPNFEVVLVDDGSTMREAQAFLHELEWELDQRGWQLVRQENRYLGAARNLAARHARGQYLLFMDDDNYAKPHELTTLVAVAERTGAEIVTTFMDFFEGREAPEKGRSAHCRWLFAGIEAPLVGIGRNCFGDANALVRRDAFETLGGFTEEQGVTHEDWELFARAVLRGFRLEVVPEALFWYRCTPNSMIRTTSAYANYARHLRPYLEEVPEPYRDLVRLAQGQVLRNLELEQQLAKLSSFRYRFVDRLNDFVKRVPFVHRIVCRLVGGRR
jgi:GT2 family glycosyltransferase